MKAAGWILLLMGATPPFRQNDAEPRFLKLGAGTKWHYSVSLNQQISNLQTETTLIESKANAIVVEVRHKKEGKQPETLRQTYALKDGFLMLDSTRLFKLGSKKGDQWTYRVLEAECTATNHGLESVTVPAGTYKEALRLTHRTGNDEINLWLVSAVGIVKSEQRTGGTGTLCLELKEFKPAENSTGPPTDDQVTKKYISIEIRFARDFIKAGKKEQAVKTLEDLIKQYPQHPDTQEARRLLEELKK